jgi:hypothetical protein
MCPVCIATAGVTILGVSVPAGVVGFFTFRWLRKKQGGSQK